MDSESAQERFERLLDQLESDRDGPWHSQREQNQPTIVLEEDEDGYVVSFDLTAFDPGTVSAHLDERTLVLTAERIEAVRGGRPPSTAESSSHSVDGRTRRYTTLETVAFPDPIEQSSLDVAVTDGVATVILEKAERENEQPSTP